MPVFVDVAPDTYNVDVGKLEEVVTDQTRAVLLPDLIGNLPDWTAIRGRSRTVTTCSSSEDSADTLGATIHGQPSGRWSDTSTTSFYGSHVINCAGNGGLLCTDDDEVNRRARLLRSWGRSSSLFVDSEDSAVRFDVEVDGIPYDRKFIFEMIGHNMEPSELGAAYGLVQLDRLEENVTRRARNFHRHLEFFQHHEQWFSLPRQLPGSHTGWLAFPTTIRDDAPFTRKEFQIALERADVQTRTVFTGNVLRQPAFRDIACRRQAGELPGGRPRDARRRPHRMSPRAHRGAGRLRPRGDHVLPPRPHRMIERVLVTGATGYVGSRLATRLAADGVRVLALVREGASGSAPDAQGVEPIVDPGSAQGLAEALAGPVDAVFHLAARYVPREDTQDVDALVESNVLLTARLLEATARTRSRCFVNTGTYWQHARGPAYSPNSLYAATKQAASDLVTYYAQQRGLPSVTLILYDVYGPADPRPKLLAALRQAAVSGRAIDLTPGEQRLCLVHVDDVCDAFVHAARTVREGRLPGRGESYAVTEGPPRRLRDVVATYARVAGEPPPVRWGGRAYPPGQIMEPWVGTPLPGWTAHVALDEGIASVLACDRG